MANVKDMKVNPPANRLVGDMPKVGIRPTIDGRLGGVRESLEEQTMAMARSVANAAATCSAPGLRSSAHCNTPVSILST